MQNFLMNWTCLCALLKSLITPIDSGLPLGQLIRGFTGTIDSEVAFGLFLILVAISSVMNGLTRDENLSPAVKSSPVSAPDCEVCPQSVTEIISKCSSTSRQKQGIPKSKPKTSRKRGRPKGKKTTSHPLLRRPKRPLSGYNLFFKDQRDAIIGKDGNHEGSLKFAELAKTIGARWKALDEETVKVYESRGADEMTKYKLVMKEYNRKVKILDDSVISKTNDSDNGSAADLSSNQEDDGSIHGQVNKQEDGTTTSKASATLGNDCNAAHSHPVHTNDSTSHTKDLQTVAKLTTANAPLLSTQLHETMSPSNNINADSPMAITQEPNQVCTNVTTKEVTASQTTTSDQEINGSCQTGAKSDESDFTFDLIDDVLGFDKNESSLPDACFLVFNSQL